MSQRSRRQHAGSGLLWKRGRRRGRYVDRTLKRLFFAAWMMVVSAVLEPASLAANYPNRPIHLVVPYPAGGGADHWARLVADRLSTRLAQPVVIDNVPGRGGNNGTAIAARAAPDGYTLLLGSVGPLVVHPLTYASLPFAPHRDFVPIALLESSPIVLVASAGVPVNSVRELIELARAKPGSLSYASNGNGSPEQVAGELFRTRLDIDLHHVPYDGAGPARKAVVAGQAALMFDPCKGAFGAIRQGLQKPLAVAAPRRLAQLPDVPTFAEVGLRNYELRIWTGILAPAGTPAATVSILNDAVQAIVRSPEIRAEIAQEGGEAGTASPAQFARYIDAERRHWGAAVRESRVPQVL
jgi:tripartite-type tricarboxylate transporter receptor subunit TctC